MEILFLTYNTGKKNLSLVTPNTDIDVRENWHSDILPHNIYCLLEGQFGNIFLSSPEVYVVDFIKKVGGEKGKHGCERNIDTLPPLQASLEMEPPTYV